MLLYVTGGIIIIIILFLCITKPPKDIVEPNKHESLKAELELMNLDHLFPAFVKQGVTVMDVPHLLSKEYKDQYNVLIPGKKDQARYALYHLLHYLDRETVSPLYQCPRCTVYKLNDTVAMVVKKDVDHLRFFMHKCQPCPFVMQIIHENEQTFVFPYCEWTLRSYIRYANVQRHVKLAYLFQIACAIEYMQNIGMVHDALTSDHIFIRHGKLIQISGFRNAGYSLELKRDVMQFSRLVWEMYTGQIYSALRRTKSKLYDFHINKIPEEMQEIMKETSLGQFLNVSNRIKALNTGAASPTTC